MSPLLRPPVTRAKSSLCLGSLSLCRRPRFSTNHSSYLGPRASLGFQVPSFFSSSSSSEAAERSSEVQLEPRKVCWGTGVVGESAATWNMTGAWWRRDLTWTWPAWGTRTLNWTLRSGPVDARPQRPAAPFALVSPWSPPPNPIQPSHGRTNAGGRNKHQEYLCGNMVGLFATPHYRGSHILWQAGARCPCSGAWFLFLGRRRIQSLLDLQPSVIGHLVSPPAT